MKRLMFVLLACACRGGAVEEVSPKVAVHCVPASSRPLPETIVLRGVVAAAPDHDALVAPQVSGRLVAVHVREGDRVARGDVVAEVEAVTLRAATAEAAAAIRQAEAAKDEAAAAVARTAHLVEVGTAARQSLEVAQAQLAHAQGSLDVARAQAGSARENLGRAMVRAPVDGLVLHLLRRAGEVVDGTPATPVVEIADPAALELSASPSAAQVVRLEAGQVATVAFEAWPGKTVAATVRTVSPSVDPASGVGAVHLTLAPGELKLPFGLLGTAEIMVGEASPTLVVPAAAVRSRGGGAVEVVACRDGKAAVLPVKVGRRRNGEVEVVDGLVPDTQVAVTEVVALEDGAEIEVTP